MGKQTEISKQEPAASFGALRSFGRIHGKKLSARQQWLVAHLLPQISPQPIAHSPKSENEKLWANGYGLTAILEIGFGAGEHLLQLARENPDTIIIGAEPFINGVASLLSQIADSNQQIASNKITSIIKPEYKNIRIFPDDVRKLLSANCYLLSEIWILHPDPWPKARHEKRRLLSAEFLTILSNHLAPGGQIIIGTDHHEYYDWIVQQVKKTNLLITNYQLPTTIKTRYQLKNKAGTDAPKYMVLEKIL